MMIESSHRKWIAHLSGLAPLECQTAYTCPTSRGWSIKGSGRQRGRIPTASSGDLDGVRRPEGARRQGSQWQIGRAHLRSADNPGWG